MNKEEKLKLADDAVKKINKNYGDKAVIRLNEMSSYDGDVVSTGSINLDEALGIGGLPKGRIVEIYGPESSGKTTVATHVIAESQAKGGVCAVVDVEHAFDPSYAQKLGVNTNELLISQPDCAEDALQTVIDLANSGGIDVIVLDSIAALVPRKELEGEVGDSTIGLQARLMGQFLRMVTPVAKKKDVLIILINQLREKIGVMFGSPETTSGGNATKFYSSIRIDVRRSYSGDNATKNSDDEIIGNKVTCKIIKNKVAPPFKKAIFDVLYGVGIDKVGEIIDLGKKRNILKYRANVVTFENNKYSMSDFRNMIEDNEEFKEDLRSKIMNYEANTPEEISSTIEENVAE